ncbi:Mpv17/PMP22 family protein [Wukongibacter baidiensis]|uniref:Mpv17/PMP22 family protein n=1 Tax=Wukongibacter baidiensis TaxID=1723361 RepID=UPI003D7F8751
MKKGDFLWLSALAAFVLILVLPATHEMFVQLTTNHPYIGGFIKFAILATMGELLAIRIATGDWNKPSGIVYRSAIWGFLGMVIVLIFGLFAMGVKGSLANGMLPGGESKFAFAFFVSSIMNLTFAPTMMAFHRITDTYIDLKYDGKGKVTINDVVSKIDWNGFVSFVVVKTIPIFWIPAHTITFLLPPEYRVLVAAGLSIALGAILAFAKKKQSKTA